MEVVVSVMFAILAQIPVDRARQHGIATVAAATGLILAQELEPVTLMVLVSVIG